MAVCYRISHEEMARLQPHLTSVYIFRAGTFGAILEYGAEKKVSQNSTLAASLALGVPTGVHLKLK